jgi:hypothetical protein
MIKILEKIWEQDNRYKSSVVDFQAAYNLYGERKYGVKCIN